MSHLSKLQKRCPGHGKYIWLFSHIKTHQVLCALSPHPKEHKMLKQLTFYGKQTQAQEIRADLFQPFAAIVTPSPEFGMNVYQKLREYRHVRDYQWTFRPTTKEVEETLEKAMEEKRLPRFDQTLPTLKERGKLLMDQKASTIADLAHILSRETKSARIKKAREKGKAKKARRLKEAKWTEVKELALKAEAGELQKFNSLVMRREDAIQAAETPKKKALGKKGLMMLKIKRNQLLRAKEGVDFVRGLEVPLAQRLKWNQNFSAMVQSRTKRIVNPEKPPPPPEEPEEEPEETVPRILRKKKTKSGDPIYATDPSKNPRSAGIDPRFTPNIREQLDGYQGPEDILIQWKDESDAYYAEEWPPEVMHQHIPDTKYAAMNDTMDDTSAAEAEQQEAAEREAEEADEKRKNSFMGKFKDAVRAPFEMNSVKTDGQEARR
ncbi:hypothetical protein EG328_005852 [Venturia inaequalis]|uniref:Large ribosomal subunit protein mL67 n=1 Tax=Venturia inaequalis TaxID=5025 RepID=A0A8H3Z5Q3_VENIN|nr:hypothetical protein EG328_005852 [Venturia inaequalis]